MDVNLINILLIIVFLYPITKGFLMKFSSDSLKYELQQLWSNIAFVIALFYGIYFCSEVFMSPKKQPYINLHHMLPGFIHDALEVRPGLVYLLLMPTIVFILHKLIYWLMDILSRISFYPLLEAVEEFMKSKSAILKHIVGAAIQLPRSIAYVLIFAFILNVLSIYKVNPELNRYLEKSSGYKYLCKEYIIPLTNTPLAKQLPNVLNNSFKVVTKEGEPTSTHKGRTIVYYNGVTLEEGVRSNAAIDNFARELVLGEDNSLIKARKIYNWVGSNISYDQEKAKRVLNNDLNIRSGAIATYESRKGICFDYACLYAAMCRADGLKVRLVTGEGFNGVSWVGHAWNQVYIPELSKWVNVDATFYNGGNYFNNKRFDKDHRDANIVGEW